MPKSYVGDVGTIIRVSTGVNLSAADSYVFKVKRPAFGEIEADEVEWEPSIEGAPVDGILFYEVTDDDFDRPGDYKLQSFVTFPDLTHTDGDKWTGSLTIIKVYEVWT